MKLKPSIFFLLLFSLLVAGCFVQNKTAVRNEKLDDSIKESQYYRIFIDATKNALFGNYKYAVPLYNECINIFPERAASYFQLSSIYLQQQEMDKAVFFARKACGYDSLNNWYKVHLANIYQYIGRIDSSIILYEQLVRNLDDDELKYNLASMYTKHGQNIKALELINGLESNMRVSKEILMLKHNAFHNMMNYDSAIFVLESVARYFPDDISSYGMLAEYLGEIGKNEHAKNVYETILKTDPTNGLLLLSFAEFYIQTDDIDSAFIFYKRAFTNSSLAESDKIKVILKFISNMDFVKQNQDKIMELMGTLAEAERDFTYYAALADIYINLEKYDYAKPYLDTALVYEKSNFLLWEQTLLVNNYLGFDNEVIRIASDALVYFTDKPNLFLVRAYSYRNLGTYSLAITDIDSILKFDIVDRMKVQVYNLQAEIYRELKEYNKSDESFERILSIEPGNLMIRNNYAYYLSLREHNLERAEELSRLTVEMEPVNSTYLDTYGWVLFQLKKWVDSKKYLESAIRNGAYNNPEVLEHYGDVLLKLDKCHEAQEAYEQILNVDSTIQSVKLKIEYLLINCE